MANSLKASGTQSATLDTEHDLLSTTDAGAYQLEIDVNAMVGGATPDRLVIRVYSKVRTGDTERLIHEETLVGDQSLTIHQLPFFETPHHCRITIEQTDGTGRSYPWNVTQTGITPAVKSSGSQTASISTEHELLSTTDPGTYELHVDLGNYASGDVLMLRIYSKALSGGTERLLEEVPVPNYPPRFKIFRLYAKANVHHYRVTLTQSAGTGRAFPWAVYDLAA